MPTTWNLLTFFLSDVTRKNVSSVIQCTCCGNDKNYVKNGNYTRYLFNDGRRKIQRYRCDNDQCPQKTFSVLPHAFLPVLRASLCMLMHILMMHEKEGRCVAEIARKTGNTWSRIKRWIQKAISIREWLSKENIDICTCLSRGDSWSSFTRKFSWAFYPARFS